MEFKYPATGICGLSCRLCPRYHSTAESRCGGCKSESRTAAGCPFITCARKKGVEACVECPEGEHCERWKKHRAIGKGHDSFVCYARLEDNIAYQQKYGLEAFEQAQEQRCDLLRQLIAGFDDGRSRSYFCIAATLLDDAGLRDALAAGSKIPPDITAGQRAKAMRAILDRLAEEKGLTLKLRK